MRFEKNFWRSAIYYLVVNADGQEKVYQYPLMNNGYEYEAMHVMECLCQRINTKRHLVLAGIQ